TTPAFWNALAKAGAFLALRPRRETVARVLQFGVAMSDLSRVPLELRRYVVEQDYAQYNEVDQAVWRFVLLQTYQRLQHTAHPAYRDGLAQTGISVDRIPRISEMSERLARFGWSAVCVDGFIPP